jgi:Domain of unknown function (DUF3473)
VHPREIDPAQPRMALSRRRRFTCYVNLESTRPKIRCILRDFQVTSFERYMAERDVARRNTAQGSMPHNIMAQRMVQ